MKKPFLLLAAAAIAVFGMSARADTKIILSHTGVADYAAAFVAVDEGIFKKHGLEVTLLFAGGATSVPGLQAGSIQMATVPTTTLVSAADSGLDMVAVSGTSILDKTDTSTGLLVGTQSGIKEAKDLIGKKVAIPSVGGFLHVMARRWLADKGVDAKKVSFVEVLFPQMGNVMKSGTVQAAVSADPFLKRAVHSGDASVLAYLAPDLPPNTTGVLYITSRDWASHNEEAIKEFRAAITESVALIQKDPQKARSAIGKYTKLPPEVLGMIAMPHLVADVTVDQMKFWTETMREQGLLRTSPDPAKLIYK